MIELDGDKLVFSFPEVHPEAVLRIEFMRTLRIPDDERTYFLPPGLGAFPLRHVDDFQKQVPPTWLEHGGVMLPMYQAEALWLNFRSSGSFLEYVMDSDKPHDLFQFMAGFEDSFYPFIIRIGTGKINAVTGKPWTDQVSRDPQDYVVTPGQPWLDGYCVEKGVIRQFVAMPLGEGYTAEEQISGKAESGGLQIVVFPMKREAYEAYEAKKIQRLRELSRSLHQDFCASMPSYDMGIAPGGRMKQEIYDDPYKFDDWDLNHRSRCFVHIANSVDWRAITGEVPPTLPPTAAHYNLYGLPWFDYYDADIKALDGAKALEDLKSVAQMSAEKGETILPENESFETGNVITLSGGKSKHLVREGKF
jgi:hypothetical protein